MPHALFSRHLSISVTYWPSVARLLKLTDTHPLDISESQHHQYLNLFKVAFRTK